MTIARLELERFTAFEAAQLELVEGVNVFIGGNGTGKTHAMKVGYALLKTFEHTDEGLAPAPQLTAKLARVFRPDDLRVARLVRRRHGKGTSRIRVRMSSGQRINVSISSAARTAVRVSDRPKRGLEVSAAFLPSREVLAMYEGFAGAYERRELSFDETYFDTVVALSAPALKGPRPKLLRDVAGALEEEIGGPVRLLGDRFYVRRADGNMEAHLVAEGHRKLASVVHLIANGTLRTNAVLFWDEPEANLNPRLIRLVADCISKLAAGGVQVVLATHDFLLADAISWWHQYRDVESGRPPVRFFVFAGSAEGAHVSVADSFAEAEPNLILEEFEDHYDSEQQLIARRLRARR